jgi:hypothetical protein
MRQQMSLAILIIGFISFPMLACQRKDPKLSDAPKIIQTVEASPGGLVAIVDQIPYANGLLTSEEDRVRIVDPQKNKPEGEVVFAEDSEQSTEKPVITWSGGKLVISFSRDANVLFQRPSFGGVQIEVVRRKELQGVPPIGPMLQALQDSQRIWSRDDLTAKVLETCRGRKSPATRDEVAAWARLLDTDLALKTDTTLLPGIRVREVALLCIEELTGESFIPSRGGQETPMRDLLATARGGKPEQFRVVKIEQSDMPGIQKSVQAWLSSKPSK